MWLRQSYKFSRPRRFDPRATFALAALGGDPSLSRVSSRGFRCLRWYRQELVCYTVGWNETALVAALDGAETAIGEFSESTGRALLGLADLAELQLDRSDPLFCLHHEGRGLHLVRFPWLYEGSLQVALNQRVSWAEASANWRNLCRCYGEPREGMWSAPSPHRLLSMGWPDFARCGVEQKRAVALKGIAHALGSLDFESASNAKEVEGRLDGLPRVGPWTKTLIRGQVLGDPDAVPLGDYGLPDLVCRTLADERHGNDERMLELLAPYLGQRFRVIRLLWAMAPRGDRRGPRLPLGQALGPAGLAQGRPF